MKGGQIRKRAGRVGQIVQRQNTSCVSLTTPRMSAPPRRLQISRVHGRHVHSHECLFFHAARMLGQVRFHRYVTRLPSLLLPLILPCQSWLCVCKTDQSERFSFILNLFHSILCSGTTFSFLPLGDQWRCMFFAEHLAPYLLTPFFIVQSKYDYWQMDNNIYCKMFNGEASRYEVTEK